ncbi:hypothetical protein SAY87_010660 [Trapa incisa]|uniref:Uncharacterized protein n=1 Tax=Trapa incisa TaxID=236973 RepID=A0AAN7GPT9_9MYRT|nr:hypothetical protein SAY87_010660 [Trapa incisa]
MAKLMLAIMVILLLLPLTWNLSAVSSLSGSIGVDQEGMEKSLSAQEWICEIYGRKICGERRRRSLRIYQKPPPPAPTANRLRSYKTLPPPPPPSTTGNNRSSTAFCGPPPPPRTDHE